MNRLFGDGCLSMWGAADQIPNRGPITTSYSTMGEEGVTDAVQALAERVLTAADQRPLDQSYREALAELEPARLTQAALAAVTSLPRFSNGAADAEELARQLRLLDELHARHASRDGGDLLDACRDVVAKRMAQLHEALRAAFETRPRSLEGVLQDCNERLGALRRTDHPGGARSKAGRALAKLRELPQHEESLLRPTYQRVAVQLLAIAREAVGQAMVAAIDDAIWRLLQADLAALPQRIRRLRDDAARCASHLAELAEVFRAARKAVRGRQEAFAGAGALLLPGPTKEQVLADALLQSGEADLAALGERLLAEWESQLRHDGQPPPSMALGDRGLASCLIAKPTAALAGGLEQVVRRTLGSQRSLYREIQSYGIERWAAQLIELAGPTCFFPDAQHARFGLSPTHFAVVRLPAAVTSEDEEIRVQVKAACDAAFTAAKLVSHIENGAAAEHEIYLTRLGTGYIPASDGVGQALLADYQEADDEGHPVHLIGFVPDSQAGRASRGYCLLPPPTRSQDSSHEHNGDGDRAI
jgi:hypothetical protein